VSRLEARLGVNLFHRTTRSPAATGRVFLTWGTPKAIAPVRGVRLRLLTSRPDLSSDMEPTKAGIADLEARTRARDCASVDGRYIPGPAAQVPDWQGQMQAAVIFGGIDPETLSPGTPHIDRLLAYCAEKSAIRTPA
jgi:hypothetical protein